MTISRALLLGTIFFPLALGGCVIPPDRYYYHGHEHDYDQVDQYNERFDETPIPEPVIPARHATYYEYRETVTE